MTEKLDKPLALEKDARTEMLRLIAQRAPHLFPIYNAVAKSSANFLAIAQDCDEFDVSEHKGIIAIVCDDPDECEDDDGRSLGPSGFPFASMKKYFASCTAIAVLSGGICEAAYASAAAIATKKMRNVAIVETQESHDMLWIDFVKQCSPKANLSFILMVPEKEKMN